MRKLSPEEEKEFHNMIDGAEQLNIFDFDGVIYGYARISRPQQSIDRQIRNILRNFPGAHIYQEAFTGRKMDRPEWNKLEKKLQSGDMVVFDDVSRMARTAEEGVEKYFLLFDKNIRLVFLKQHYIDTEVYRESIKDRIKLTGTDTDEIIIGINNYFRKIAEKQIRIAFEEAENEVQYLRQRTREGIETARKNGKQIGQKPGRKLHVKKTDAAKNIILKHSKSFGGSLSDKECMKLANLSNNTYYKYKNELKEKYAAE